ncbi:MAG: inosine-5'-monophosphate dehydrogenase [Desulfuromonas sp. SDB]|nr:MAG: inosine-5'-monophosphate dehydrogenase [Desulfuromonas sp. SDB]
MLEIETALTFDDILLVPQASRVLPKDVNIQSHLTDQIKLNIPIISAAMDTVTESNLAIAMAREGGLGVIHKNMSIERQSEEVRRVKRSESGMISSPKKVRKNLSLGKAIEIMNEMEISGLCVVDEQDRLIGLLTHRDVMFETDGNKTVAEVMTSKNLITAPIGTSIHQAIEIFREKKVEKLPIVDQHMKIAGLMTVKDVEKQMWYPHASKDENGRLRVAAAVGVNRGSMDRINAVIKAGVDAVVIDTAHGQAQQVIDTVKQVRKMIGQGVIIAGNIATASAAEDLIKAGADVLKVGIGPGSICTTRVIAGVGVPQFTAIRNVVEVARKNQVSIIADGGIKYSGDIVKALAAGADMVMIGSLLAGTDESPGEIAFLEGRRFKVYRAMGSIQAMKAGSADRYFQEGATKLVPEGVVARVPYRGTVHEVIFQLIGGLKAGMGYCGAENLEQLQTKAKFVKITQAGLRESHPHDIIITEEPPNYGVSR